MLGKLICLKDYKNGLIPLKIGSKFRTLGQR